MDLEALVATSLFTGRRELRVSRRNKCVATGCLCFEADLVCQSRVGEFESGGTHDAS